MVIRRRSAHQRRHEEQLRRHEAAMRKQHELAMEIDGLLREAEAAFDAATGVKMELYYQGGWVREKSDNRFKWRRTELPEQITKLWAMVHAKELDPPVEQG